MLKKDEWKTDVVPEMMDGKNIADFFDPDIEARLEALETEEAAAAAAWETEKAQRQGQIEPVDEVGWVGLSYGCVELVDGRVGRWARVFGRVGV